MNAFPSRHHRSLLNILGAAVYILMAVETLSVCVYSSFNLARFTNMISAGTVPH